MICPLVENCCGKLLNKGADAVFCDNGCAAFADELVDAVIISTPHYFHPPIAIEAFEKRGFFVGIFLTAWRILRCNPFCKGGYDPVPEKKAKKR